MERNNNSWQTSQNPGGTPKTQNSEVIIQEKPIIPNQKQDISPETPTTYPSNIFFNEILPSPEGSDSENEYVEIFNNNEFSVNLLNWTLKDTQGSIKKYIFPNTVVKSKSFLILYRPQTKITLNNATDGLELLNPNNKVVDQITYESAPKAESYNKGEPWKWSNAPTPGKQNTITQENLEIKPNNLGANIVKQPIKKTDSNFTLLFSLALIVCLIFGLIVFLVNKQGKIYDKEDE